MIPGRYYHLFGPRKSSVTAGFACSLMCELDRGKSLSVNHQMFFPLLFIDGLLFVEHEGNYLPVEPKQNGLLFWNGNFSKTCTAKY